jgi:hypothetical protein
MPRAFRAIVLTAFVCGVLTFPFAAGAGHTTDPAVNLTPLGHIEESAVLGGFGGANPDINTDIAFWGKFAIQGNWDGFSIRNVRNRSNPNDGRAGLLRRKPGRRLGLEEPGRPVVEHTSRHCGTVWSRPDLRRRSSPRAGKASTSSTSRTRDDHTARRLRPDAVRLAHQLAHPL